MEKVQANFLNNRRILPASSLALKLSSPSAKRVGNSTSEGGGVFSISVWFEFSFELNQLSDKDGDFSLKVLVLDLLGVVSSSPEDPEEHLLILLIKLGKSFEIHAR